MVELPSVPVIRPHRLTVFLSDEESLVIRQLARSRRQRPGATASQIVQGALAAHELDVGTIPSGGKEATAEAG